MPPSPRLVESGRVRHVGVCNLPLSTIEALAAHVELFSTQNLYSLYDRGGDDPIHLPVSAEILPWTRDHGVRFLAFSPLARGLLGAGLDPARTFPPDDERHFLPRFQPDVYPHWARLSNRLEAWAADHGRSLPAARRRVDARRGRGDVDPHRRQDRRAGRGDRRRRPAGS